MQAILFTVPRFWRGFRAMATGLKLSHQQIRRWWCETDYIWVGRLRGNCIWVCLECSWIVRSKRETERLPRVFWEAAIHHQVQQVELPYARSHSFFDHKISSSSSTTRGRSTRRSLLLRVCVHTQFHFIKKNNFFCCTPHFYPKCTGWKWRRYSEITEMVSFLVLLLSVCLSNAFFSWFVCGKMLTSYLWKEIERFDAFYAGRSTSSRLLCDQTT